MTSQQDRAGCKSYVRSRTRRAARRAGVLAGLNLGAAPRAGAASPVARAKSVLLVWVSGGLSHHDSLDPKPDAPAEIRGEFGAIPTALAGVRYGELVPRLAASLGRYTLLRSVVHGEADHGVATYFMLRGYSQPTPFFDRPENQRHTHPNIGSIVARELPARNQLPPYVVAPGLSYVEQVNYFTPGWLGPACAPYVLKADPSRPGFVVRDLFPPAEIVWERAARRHRLRAAVGAAGPTGSEAQSWTGSEGRALDATYHRALDLLTSPAGRAAFRLDDEPAALRDRYGRHRLGQSCLLARRLVEAGVPFVTVDDDGWDHHSRIFPSLRTQLPQLDAAFSTLLADLADRGALSETLVLLLTDFGRTPTINKDAGRDHWPGVFSVIAAGAGVPSGQVVGASDATGAEPADRPITPKDLARTIYHFLGVDPRKEYHTPDGRPVAYLDRGEVIRELL